MTIAAGTHLGSYDVLAPIGAGGMGEVYKAHDTKLGRDVAIKVLPETFAHDPERLSRFQREAKMLASLNHPNIAAIYGLEEDASKSYLVMELVPGETLRERIAREGPLPVEEALGICRQIAEALEAAHEKGIIHRDLKPANVKVTPEGKVKVLDFGLAKAFAGDTASSNPAESPTLSAAATAQGLILGTAAYMSPEQARGKAADKRADIWAFGCVLYELLTGKQTFQGETVTEILAAVLKTEPDWSRVPAKAQRLLRRCLERDPKRRLRDIGDAWPLLDDASHAPPAVKSSVLWKVAAGVLGLAFTIALWAPWRGPTRPIEQPLARLDLDLGPDVSLGSNPRPAAILSPDGTRLVFVSQGSDGTHRLFTRRLDQPKAAQLAGTEGAYAPFFSPDGQSVGFFAGGKLKKTRIDGGDPVALCDAPAGRGASWGEDGSIIAALDSQVGLSQVQPEVGKVISLTELSLGEVSHRWPQVLPGGNAVLFTTNSGFGNYDGAGIAVVSLEDHRRKNLLEHAGMYPRYLPSGHLVYMTKGVLFAVPFNLDRLEVRGQAKLVLEEVSNDTNFGFAQFDFSRTGAVVYRSGRTESLRTIQWLDGAGKTESFGAEPAAYLFLRLSPDGSRLAFMVSQGSSSDLWIYDWQRGSKTRLTNGMGVNAYPVWSPDGRFVVFQSAGGMFWTRADGASKPQTLTHSKISQFPNSFTPDGTRLVFSELTSGAGAELRTVPVENRSGQLRAGQPELFLKTPAVNAFAAFSPDGRWLAYADAESGTYEVNVRAFPDNGTKVQISNAGGTMPIWSRNGRELFYRTEDQRIMVANYKVRGELFLADKPRVWFGKQLANLGLVPNFDLAPDGKRFVMLISAESPEPRETQSHVTLVLNFFDEVRRRVKP
jgi:serine/threonine protein kinase/Tol biopolymer transport system component